MKKIRQIGYVVIGISLLMMMVLAAAYWFFQTDIFLATVVFGIMLIMVIGVLIAFNKVRQELADDISANLNQGSKEAIAFAKVGVLVYNNDLIITWMSELFEERSLNHTNEQLLTWLPELQDLISGNIDYTMVKINWETYVVKKLKTGRVLYFKDISKEADLEAVLKASRLVIGYVNFDNYDVATEIESDISYINLNIKVPVFEYFKKHQIVYKSLYNNRLLIILDEERYDALRKDRFSIINTVRKEAKKAGFDITLSMVFARGDVPGDELDQMALSLMELAQTRGGDQVVVRKAGEEAIFFGGSSEAKEKQSKVKARVISNTLKDLILKSSNVIIVGHQEMDADCVGSALCMSAIVRGLNKECAIIAKTGGIEPMINDVLNQYKEDVEENFDLVSESEAINRLIDDTLVIMVDHHNAAQSNGSQLLKATKKIVIIDHHRRNADLDVDPILLYVEASASSTCELTVEFMPYLLRKNNLSANIVNIMYLGLLIDTNHFRVRTGVRTFDVAKTLRQMGADPSECERLSQEPFEMVKKRSRIIDASAIYHDRFAIAALDDGIYTRSIMSQASDQMLQMKEISAAFVICPIGKEDIAISARSQKDFNVQTIMEKMGGGGHMTAAGLQRKNESVQDVVKELQAVLDEQLSKEDQDESNSAE